MCFIYKNWKKITKREAQHTIPDLHMCGFDVKKYNINISFI